MSIASRLRGLIGGGTRPAQSASAPHATTTLHEPQDQNEFALAMYGQLCSTPGNLFFSPFSVRAVLMMACAGARGATRAQMNEVLGFHATDEDPFDAVATIIARLNATDVGGCEVNIANSLWGQEGAPLREEFLEVVSRKFAGAMQQVDFRHAAEAARARINAWVENKTKQRIRELIPAGGVGALTRLVLANAVYFKGVWRQQFDEKQTRDKPFWLLDGKKVRVPLMHQFAVVSYGRANSCQIVELPYQGGNLSTLVLVPDRKEGLRDLESMLTARIVEDWVARMSRTGVEIFLPRFKVNWGTQDLTTALAALGMSLPFTDEADFSGINGFGPGSEESVRVSNVLHKAFVELNEEGTEAAAATATLSPTSSSGWRMPTRTPVFRADHPFVYAIRDRVSRALLFLGRLEDPTKAS